MLSLTCKTAVKAVIYLATKSTLGVKSGIKEIADNISASEHTVGKLLQTLVKQGVINSLKGPFGGFYITEAQKLLPIIHIIEAIDGPNAFRECGLGLSQCSALHPCPIHDEYKVGRDILENMFRSKNVKDLCEPVNNGLAYLFG